MNKRMLMLALLLTMPFIEPSLYARSKHKRHKQHEQSMVTDILYTTIGAGFIIASLFAGKFTYQTYQVYKDKGHASVANSKGFETNKFIMWYKEHAELTVPAEIIGLAFCTGLLASTGMHCIFKGLHLKN